MKRQDRWGHPGLLVLLTVALGLAFSAPAFADPIGGPNDIYGCAGGTCQGSTYILFYSGSPFSVDDVNGTKTYDVTLLIKTSTYTGGGTKLDSVAMKVSSSLIDGLLMAAPGGTSNWTEQLGGLNSGGCDGSGSGFDCAMANSTGVAPNVGGNLSWTFRLEIPNTGGGINTSVGGSSIKARYVDGTGAKVGALVSENITLQVCDRPDGCHPPQEVPEPSTLLLLGAGLMGLARRQVRR